MANIATDDTLFDHGIAAGNAQHTHAGSAGSLRLGIANAFKVMAENLYLARQRRVDADVGRFIQEHGGQLTDDIERQISRRFGTHSGQW